LFYGIECIEQIIAEPLAELGPRSNPQNSRPCGQTGFSPRSPLAVSLVDPEPTLSSMPVGY
jgi:hypothetical protein